MASPEENRELAISAARRWERALFEAKTAELALMDALKRIPTRTVSIAGRRYVAVVSRNHVDVRPPKTSKATPK